MRFPPSAAIHRTRGELEMARSNILGLMNQNLASRTREWADAPPLLIPAQLVSVNRASSRLRLQIVHQHEAGGASVRDKFGKAFGVIVGGVYDVRQLANYVQVIDR